MDSVMLASIFVLILVVVLAVIVILRRQDGESIYYDEEDWDDATGSVEQSMGYDAPYAMEAQKVLPPMPESTPTQALESTNTGPPPPDSGLPDGWTMEQWNHYGEQWLLSNTGSATVSADSQPSSDPQFVLSGDGYYYQYQEDGSYAKEAYIKADDGTFKIYQP